MKLLLLAALLLTGCTYTWTRPGATDWDARQARYQCQLETSGSVSRSGMGGAIGIAEALAQHGVFKECMQLRGFTLVAK